MNMSVRDIVLNRLGFSLNTSGFEKINNVLSYLPFLAFQSKKQTRKQNKVRSMSKIFFVSKNIFVYLRNVYLILTILLTT